MDVQRHPILFFHGCIRVDGAPGLLLGGGIVFRPHVVSTASLASIPGAARGRCSRRNTWYAMIPTTATFPRGASSRPRGQGGDTLTDPCSLLPRKRLSQPRTRRRGPSCGGQNKALPALVFGQFGRKACPTSHESAVIITTSFAPVFISWSFEHISSETRLKFVGSSSRH